MVITMAINLNTKRNKHSRRCLYYKARYINNNTELISNAVAEGVFYVMDKVAYKEYTEVLNGVARTKVKTLTIETNDYVPNLDCDDYVLYEGDLWRVVSVEKDDQEKNKFFSSRAATTTTIELRR